MRLYGNDIDESTTALEAGLEWVVAWQKEGAIGVDSLRQLKAAGVPRSLVGLELIDPGIARHGYPVLRGGHRVGVVTSGTQTPFLKKSVAMAYVPADLAAVGTELEVEIRGRVAKARVVPLPFYRRSKR